MNEHTEQETWREEDMPTLEERQKETQAEKHIRIEQRTVAMGITYSFSEYIDMMEQYILELEQRVKTLEKRLDLT